MRKILVRILALAFMLAATLAFAREEGFSHR